MADRGGTSDPGELLARLQNPDDGWGPAPGAPSTTEATALTVLALAAGGRTDAAAAGRRWLVERQRPDGAWPHSDLVTAPSWATPLAILAVAAQPAHREKAIRGGRWLLDLEGRAYPWVTRLFFRLFPERKAIELDADLTGWPWLPGTFSWVEPTAYAILALRAVAAGLPAAEVSDRIAEGRRMILDRTCEDGGWNYGNSRVLGEELWSYPDTTALALLALRDGPEDPRIGAGLDALARELATTRSGLALSLGLLAFRAFDRPLDSLATELVDALPAIVRHGSLRSLALVVGALSVGPHPLLPDVDGP